MTLHTIRPASDHDLPQIEKLSDLVQNLHAEARPDVFRMPVDHMGRRAFFQSALSSERWDIDVATAQDKVVAYIMTELLHKDGPIRTPHTEGHIHQICVDPHYRRRGLGRALVGHAIDSFQRKSVSRITVAY